MKQILFGKSGLKVSEISLGTMTFGEEWGWGAPKSECKKIFDTYVEAGGNFIDTANKYTNGSSEKMVGELIKKEREKYVVATKYSLSMDPDDPNASGNSRKNMMQSVEASLKRLETDYIDLLWLHMWDFTTPIDEVMRGLDDLVRSGKVTYIGISDAPAWIVSSANMMAELRGWNSFVGLQLKYNLFDRTIEREFVPMAKQLGISITAWSPLYWGLLSGKYSVKGGKLVSSDNSKRIPEDGAKNLSEERLAIISKVEEVANNKDRSMAQVALRWLMEKGTIPIIGGTKSAQIKDNLGASDFSLSAQEIELLDEASSFEPGFPHDFLQIPNVRNILYGNSFEQKKKYRMPG